MASSSRRCTCPRSKSQNMYHLLMDREHGIDRRHQPYTRPAHKFNIEFFKCIPPNLTVSNIEKPPNFIRKFSPDGKYLICFSKDQQSFENYKFLGTANASDLIYNWKTEYIAHDAVKGYGKEIRHNIFNRLFRMKWSIQLTLFMRPLYREFSLFSEDGKFVIVATYMPVQEENIPSYYTLNTIHGIQFDYDLNSYRFYTVRLEDGVIWDSIEYTYDFINLSHNHGVCIHGNMIAVVSLFHQWVNIVQLDNGKFIKLFTIGRYFHGSDDCLCSTVPEYKEHCIALSMKSDGLKQKILTRMYKNILNCPLEESRSQMLQQFYRKYNVYHSMEIHKAQFIDTDHVMIRYDTNKQLSYRADGHDLSKLYVIYSINKNEVLSVYHEKDRDLLCALTSFFDDFRRTTSVYTGRAPSSVSNNIYLRHSQRRLMDHPNGVAEAAYRLLPQLPMSSQSFTVSPYLDLDLFRYDDRLISALERPRYSSCEPIRFTDRDTELTKFRIYSALPDQPPSAPGRIISKELVAYIFHPYEPFVISVQKLSNRYVTNFHIRNEGTHVNF